MEANIKESFEYAAQEAKRDFQANINSLLEIHSLFTGKLQHAKNKNVVFLSTDEVDTLQEWILSITSSLMENYALIDHSNRITNKLYKACSGAGEHRKKLRSLTELNDLLG